MVSMQIGHWSSPCRLWSASERLASCSRGRFVDIVVTWCTRCTLVGWRGRLRRFRPRSAGRVSAAIGRRKEGVNHHVMRKN